MIEKRLAIKVCGWIHQVFECLTTTRILKGDCDLIGDILAPASRVFNNKRPTQQNQETMQTTTVKLFYSQASFFLVKIIWSAQIKPQ